MAMSTGKRAAITAALVAAFGGALFFALRGQQQAQIEHTAAVEAASTVELKGLIALDVEPYFKDPRVIRVLAAKKLPVNVVRVGSRDMAGKVLPGAAPDFLFPSGVVAANQIVDAARKANLPAAQVSPFFTPMVIASWEPIAKILVANGIAKPLSPKVYGVDMAKLTQVMLAKKKWKEFKDSSGYDVGRSVLVSTTDLRRSNSGAMYLALTSAALTGDVVTDRASAQATALKLVRAVQAPGLPGKLRQRQLRRLRGHRHRQDAHGLHLRKPAGRLRAQEEGRGRRHGAAVPAAHHRQQGGVRVDERTCQGPGRAAGQ